MVKYSAARLDDTFFALSDPTRRAMITRLARREATVGELAAPFRMSAPAVSKHLRVLERAGLVQQDRLGRVRRCRLVPLPLAEAAAWVEKHRRFWEAQLDQLGRYIEQVQSTTSPPARSKRKEK
jgi:DNA-binding transcriptional ArsR family regulator